MMEAKVVLLETRRKMTNNYPKCTKINSEALTNHEITYGNYAKLATLFPPSDKVRPRLQEK